jgi:hypothetical protein
VGKIAFDFAHTNDDERLHVGTGACRALCPPYDLLQRIRGEWVSIFNP